MPITNKDALIRMASNCGAKIPESLLQKSIAIQMKKI
jgi:5,10-methylenetetrahydrofolate reductase